MKKFSKVPIVLALLFTGMIVMGCANAPLPTIDVSEAEFSSEENYAQYDQEATELSAGQEP